MKIKKKYLNKYLHDIAIDQMVEDYSQRGYIVKKEEMLGKYQADLIARKGDEQIVIEVKSGRMSPDRKAKIAGLADYIHNIGGYKFIAVIATPPKEKKLEIDDIDQLISDYIHNDSHSVIDILSSHSKIDEVIDVDVDEITFSGNLIFIKGDGVVSVELQFGSDGDLKKGEGSKSFDSFPFDFEMSLKYNDAKKLEIFEVSKFKVDTSSYYEN
jgi:Holliday junction resolvase